MLRKLVLLVGLMLCVSITSQAQSITDKIQVFGGYSFMHVNTSPSFNTNGWEVSGQYKLWPWVGAVADVDGHYGTIQGVHSTVNNYLFGPQVSFPAPVSPFAHVLFGETHFSGGGVTNSSFATGFGFGFDSKIAPFLAWRIAQVDFVHSHMFNTGQTNTRVSTGLVIHF